METFIKIEKSYDNIFKEMVDQNAFEFYKVFKMA